MPRGPSFLAHREFLYLRAATLAGVFFVAVFFVSTPSGLPAYGGSPLGYFFGILATLLLPVLLWYGVRKRLTPRISDRRSGVSPEHSASKIGKERRKAGNNNLWRYGGSLRGWLSTHVYLGGLFLLLVLLHAGFHLGLSMHALPLALALMVVLSGVYGVFAYTRYPAEMTRVQLSDTPESMRQQLGHIERQIDAILSRLPDTIRAELTGRLSATGPQEDQSAIVMAKLSQWNTQYSHEVCPISQPEDLRKLFSLFAHRARLQSRLAKSKYFDLYLSLWLYIHVPVSMALMAATLAHIAIVIAYW